MEQEQRTDQRYDNELLDQRTLERINRALDEFGTVVRRHDFDTLRETLLQLRETRFHSIDRARCILAPAA